MEDYGVAAEDLRWNGEFECLKMEEGKQVKEGARELID